MGLALGFGFFEHVQWPFDPFPNFVGGCWPPSVMPWYFLEGPKKCALDLLDNWFQRKRSKGNQMIFYSL